MQCCFDFEIGTYNFATQLCNTIYFPHTYRETLMQVALHPGIVRWSIVCRSVYQLEGKANTSSTNPEIPTNQNFL